MTMTFVQTARQEQVSAASAWTDALHPSLFTLFILFSWTIPPVHPLFSSREVDRGTGCSLMVRPRRQLLPLSVAATTEGHAPSDASKGAVSPTTPQTPPL